MNTKTGRTDLSKGHLFSKRSLLSAFVGGVIFLMWAFVSMNLPWSAFRKAFVDEDLVSEYVTRIASTLFCGGTITGFVGFHLWNSKRRAEIIRWMVIAGGGGAAIGILVGAFTEVPAVYSSLWPYHTFGHGRSVFLVQMLSRFCVITASLAALFASTERRAILKGIFVPMALGITVRVVLLSFVPVETDFFRWPWNVMKLVSSETGYDTGIVIVVALVVALIRKIRHKPIQNSDE